MPKFTLSVLVENKFGVLARVAGLFSARGFNIDSLAVSATDDASMSSMTVVVDADERTLEQIKKQLNKLIDVIKVIDLTKKHYIDRELVLINVKITDAAKEKIIGVVDSVGAHVLDVGKATVTIEETGDTNNVNALIELLRPFGITEVVRTGKIAIQTEGEKKEEKGNG
ncbi:MAG: acetolactate synthase small subunit [Candidatus Omnitrophica bacterium]|nr:acetolactate synthase small subunit [Candidatus Omnitrophota bacterium]